MKKSINEEITTWSKASNYTPDAFEIREEPAVDKYLVQEVINRMTDLSVNKEEYIKRLKELNAEFPTKVVVGEKKIQKYSDWK